MSNLFTNNAEPSSQDAPSPRSVFICEWGRTGKRPISFHYCLLVLDPGWTSVERTSPGKLFDWGSVTPPIATTKVKDFTATTFDMGETSRNEYRHIGETEASDEHIRQTMDAYGYKFNAATNNCRDVTEDVAQAIVIVKYKKPAAPYLLPVTSRDADIKVASKAQESWVHGLGVASQAVRKVFNPTGGMG